MSWGCGREDIRGLQRPGGMQARQDCEWMSCMWEGLWGWRKQNELRNWATKVLPVEKTVERLFWAKGCNLVRDYKQQRKESLIQGEPDTMPVCISQHRIMLACATIKEEAEMSSQILGLCILFVEGRMPRVTPQPIPHPEACHLESTLSSNKNFP